MKTVTVSYLRYNLGAMFHEMKHHKAEYLITHGGKEIARLMQPSDVTEIMPDGSIKGPLGILERRIEYPCKYCGLECTPESSISLADSMAHINCYRNWCYRKDNNPDDPANPPQPSPRRIQEEAG
jgi:hypothetical protein